MKRLLSLVLTCAVLCGLAACTETPDTPLVAQKDIDRLLEKAQQTPDGNALSDIVRSLPDEYIWTTSAYQGRVTADVHADVTTPDRKTMPTYRVKAGEFTQEQVDAMVNRLYGGETIYDEPMERAVVLKANFDREIARYQAILDEGSEGKAWKCYALYFEGDGQVTEERVRLDLEEVIMSLQAERETAPENMSDVLEVSDGVLSNGVLNVSNEEQDRLTIGSSGAGDSSASGVFYYRHDMISYNLNHAEPAEDKTGYAEAKAIAEGFFQTADFEMAQLAAYQIDDYIADDGSRVSLRSGVAGGGFPQDATHQAFVFYYTSAVDGLAVAYDDEGGWHHGGSKEMPVYEAAWLYEFAYIVVDDEGIAEIYWRAPLTKKERVSDNTGLLTFDEARTVFEEMITIPYEGELAAMDAAGGEAYHYEISVNTVSLALIRSRAEGGERSGILTPAWVFYGDIGGTAGQASVTARFPRIVFAVNAIDGTVIDVLQGY